MTMTEIEALVTYNTEVARGIMHTEVWQRYMAGLQEQFNREAKSAPSPWPASLNV